MGCFSPKVKKYAAISNTRYVEESVRPRALKDSTASYITDLPDMTRPFETTIVDYNNLGIMQSVVTAFKSARRYSKHAKYAAMNYQTQSIGIPDIALIIDAINNKLKNEFGSTTQILYNNFELMDYTHIIKSIITDEYLFDTTTNLLTIGSQTYWLNDIDVRLREDLETGFVGYSFNSGVAPTRVEDRLREYTPWYYYNLDVDSTNAITADFNDGVISKDNVYNFKDRFILDVIPRYVDTYNINTVNTYDVTGGIRTLLSTEVLNSNEVIESPISSLLYEHVILTTVSDSTYYDGTVDGITTYYELETVIETVKDIKYGDSIKQEVLLSNYLNYDLQSLRPIGTESPETPEELLEFLQYKEDVENDLVATDIFSSIYLFFISYSYVDSLGNTIIGFRTLTDDNYPEYKAVIYNQIDVGNFGDFMPNLYLSAKGKDISKTPEFSEVAKVNKRYATKLGIKYNNFYADMYEEMEDGKDKIRTSYITFGVDIQSQLDTDIKYLYHFFETVVSSEFPLLDIPLEGVLTKPKSISQTDTLGQSTVAWKAVKYIKKTGTLLKDYESSLGKLDDSLSGGAISYLKERYTAFVFKKRISDTEYMQIEVHSYSRSALVHKGKWGKASKDSTVLVPLEYSVLKEHFKAFKDKEALIYRSMYIEFLTYVEVKVKFYQRGFFKVLIYAVGAAIAFFSNGSLASVVISVLSSLAINYALELAIKLILKAFGDKVGQTIATVLAIAAIMYGGLSAAKNLGSLGKMATIFFMKANLLINFATGLLNQANMNIGLDRQEEMDKLKEKSDELKTYAESIFGYNIDDTSYLQSNRGYISPLIGIGKSIDDIMYELTDYNKISKCIDYTHDYVDYLLALPTMDETVQQLTK